MRLRYSVSNPSQNESDSLPRLTFSLSCNNRQIEVIGLIDSGATVSVLPYEIGIGLGEVWNDRKANIRLAGNLGNFPAMPLAATAKIGNFQPVRLVFAWVRTDAPLILGQTNFLWNLMYAFTVQSLNLKSCRSHRSRYCCRLSPHFMNKACRIRQFLSVCRNIRLYAFIFA